MLAVEPCVIAQELRDHIEVLRVHGALRAAGDHQEEGINHAHGSEDQERIHPEVQGAYLETPPSDSGDNGHGYFPVVLNSSLERMRSWCTVKPISMKPRTQAIAVAGPNFRNTYAL